MNTDPAIPPSSAGLLDRLAEMAEGVRRDLVENPEANVIQFVAGALFLIALMKIAEFYMRWKAGVLPVRRARSARPARAKLASRPVLNALKPPASRLRPYVESCDPAPEHRAAEHSVGARPEADYPRTEPATGNNIAAASAVPVRPSRRPRQSGPSSAPCGRSRAQSRAGHGRQAVPSLASAASSAHRPPAEIFYGSRDAPPFCARIVTISKQ